MWNELVVIGVAHMGGYRDIMRGLELKAEYDQYIAYKGKTRAQKQAAYRALNVQRLTYTTQVAYVYPFGQPAKGVAVEVEIASGTTPAPIGTALSLAGSFFVATAPDNTITLLDNKVFPKGKLAKLIVKQRITAATSDSESRITGRSYKRHQTNSVGVFLGKNNATDDYSDVVKAIKGLSAYETFISTKGNTIQFIPEG